MSIKKPEVVAWRWRKPVVNDQGETVGATAWELSDAPGFLPWWTNDPLIRLNDYEAMRKRAEEAWVENNQLRTQLNVLVNGIELLLRRLEKMPRKIWVKEQLDAILEVHYESKE